MKSIDACRARGCGGWLRGIDAEVYDGEIATCGRCGREHMFHVAEEGAYATVTIGRRPPPTGKRRRGLRWQTGG